MVANTSAQFKKFYSIILEKLHSYSDILRLHSAIIPSVSSKVIPLSPSLRILNGSVGIATG
jgi:hypothetical protein